MNNAFNRTHTFIKRLADHITFGKIAWACGKTTDTAEAWGREPESNANPDGTGKKNPLDCVIRLIGLAHKEDAGLAREMAEVFTTYVDYLDGKSGASVTGGIQEILAKNLKEHTDVVIEIVQNADPDWSKVLVEAKQSEAAMNQLQGYALAQLKVIG